MNAAADLPAAAPFGLLDRVARRLVVRQFDRLRGGELEFRDPAGAATFGAPADLRATLRVRNPRFFRRTVLGGSLGFAESYLRGEWDCDDLPALLRLLARNADSSNRLDRGLARLAGFGRRLGHWRRANTRVGSRRNIAAHYDLGNDFYRLWLDDTLAYSCAIFPTPAAPLRDASTEKFDRVCRKLELGPADQALEIGTGWGGWALHAAGRYGCRVTTTTISAQQHAHARGRIDAAGLGDRIALLQADYRDLSGAFDKLASIEMIEAVGHRRLDEYFRRCGRLLKPDGTMVLQAIVMPERGYADYLRNVDYIQRYVFPGGCVPSLGAMLDSAGRATDLRLVGVEDFGGHYAETLRRWRHAFFARIDEVRGLGFDDRFIRLWNYYLCYCEAAFEERLVGLVQVQFDKPQRRRAAGLAPAAGP